MSNKLYSETAIQNIASSIRGKNGTQNTYTVSQMPQAILDIPSGGGGSYNNGKNNFWVYIDTANTSVTATVETSGDTIDWGDGTVDTITSHTYTNAGVYIISADSLNNVSGGNVIYIELNNAVTLSSYTSNTSLMKVKLNNSSFTTLAASAFTGCTSLTEIDMPYVTTIGDYAFYLCSSLASIDFTNITSIGQEAFSGSSSGGATAITTLVLPSTITSIGNQAFGQNKYLTTVTINCDIPITIAGIVRGCNALQSVTVGSNVTALGDYMFNQTNNTWVLHLQGTTPPALGGYGLASSSYYPSAIYVPASAVETYKTASIWSTYASIIQAEPVGE